MRIKIFIIFFLSLSGYFSQTAILNNTLKGSYGIFFPLENKFGNSFAPLFDAKLKEPIQVISIAIEHGRNNSLRNMSGDIGFLYFMKQTVKNDSVKLSWLANNFYIIWKFDLFKKSALIDVCFGAGPMVGSQRIIVTKSSNTEVYKNFNCSIVPHAEIKIQAISQLAIGAEVNYLYDFSDNKWKNRINTFSFSKSNFSGLLVKFYLGYSF
ncbi:MAG: hypothetical protein IAF38_14640 [Bacteroidia bacterium]|nr:hypothetical protein [Bacteroidia bacterium]